MLKQCGAATCLRYRLPAETFEIEAPAISIRSQLVQLEILFRNLIDNAVKYGGSPPHVKVFAYPEMDDRVKVLIIDNGAGIPANQRRKVFGRFVRLGSELERSTPGTGLGLHLVRTVTKSLGGSVRVSDRSEGTGTQFEVTLMGVVPTPGVNQSPGTDDAAANPTSPGLNEARSNTLPSKTRLDTSAPPKKL